MLVSSLPVHRSARSGHASERHGSDRDADAVVERHDVGVLEDDDFTGGTFDRVVEDRAGDIAIGRDLHEVHALLLGEHDRPQLGIVIAQVLARAVAHHELVDEGGIARDRVGVRRQFLELVLVAGRCPEAPEEAAHAVGTGVPALGVAATPQQRGRRLEDADDFVADTLGGRQFSGIGGHEDFVAGASFADHGRSLLCMPSTAGRADARVSRIVAGIGSDTPITTPRHQVDVITTEHGAAELAGRTARERRQALIAIADPAFRDELEDSPLGAA